MGSIYYHFPTREELFEAVYAEGIRHLEAAIERAVSGVEEPWQRLQRACEVHLAYLCGGDDFTAIAIPTRLPALSPAVRERVVRLSDSYEAIFRALVDALPTRADIRKGVLRLQLLGALNWTSVWYRPGGLGLSEIAEQLVRTLRRGAAADLPVASRRNSVRRSTRKGG